MTAAAGPHILAGPLSDGGALIRDYAAAHDLSPFYTGHPGDLGAYVRKADEVAGRMDPATRARVASAIQPLGDAADRLQRIIAGDGFFVTTGQQPALFGGPLYTPYKILAAIRLADVLERQLARPVLALFWIGSDDHDWNEANHATLLDAHAYTRRITVHADGAAPALPLGDRVWGPDVGRAVGELFELLPDTPYSAGIREHVRTAYTPDATVASSFTATIRHLLGNRRLAIVDSGDRAVRRAAAPVLRREAESAADNIARVARQTARLIAAGYRAPVTVAPDASNIMLHDGQGRDRLMLTPGGWTTRRQRRVVATTELLHMIGAEPDRFSPNVLLRPVVESALFPTIAYVAGPGEASYFAQIGCLFAAHGILPPVVVPRPGVTLVESKTAAILERLGMQASDVQLPFDELASRVIRRGLPADIEASLAAIRESLHGGYARLADATEAVDPTLRGPLLAARDAGLMRANRTERKIITHMRRREEVLMEQLRRAAANLYPGGKSQERVLNMLYYTSRYGPDLIDAIGAALDMEPRFVASWAGPLCE
ncbi:MAG: bacillithiol biosynthesis cysteine-adding enzyme BshC [Gemmatimonadota bacterium]